MISLSGGGKVTIPPPDLSVKIKNNCKSKIQKLGRLWNLWEWQTWETEFVKHKIQILSSLKLDSITNKPKCMTMSEFLNCQVLQPSSGPHHPSYASAYTTQPPYFENSKSKFIFCSSPSTCPKPQSGRTGTYSISSLDLVKHVWPFNDTRKHCSKIT